MYRILFLYLFTTVETKKYRSYDYNKKYPLGYNPLNITVRSSITVSNNLPIKFDWREKVNVFVRSQENCGSCWAFATISPIEYIYKYKTGLDIHLSEQYLISCNSHGYSCNGGRWDYDDLIKKGVVLFDDYPYYSKDENCKKNIKLFDEIKVLKWGYTGNTIEQIKTAIMNYGPVVSGVSVDDQFYNYIDGIYDHDSDEMINHAIVLVGWDDDLHAWILRNSWSSKWGFGGYMYIQYGVSGIGTDAAYVEVEIISRQKNKKKYINVFDN